MNQHVGFIKQDLVHFVRINFTESDKLWNTVGRVFWTNKDTGLGELSPSELAQCHLLLAR